MNMAESSCDGKGKIFYGWWIVLILSILTTYGAGVFYYGFSTFVKPIVNELGWSMAVVSGAFSLYRLEAGIAAPILGYLLDRMGPRRLVFSGGLVTGWGFIYLSHVHTVWHFYAAIIIISLGFSAFGGVAVGNPLIGKWFVKKRGSAIGIYGASRSFAGVIVPLVAWLVACYGWRTALLFMGPVTWLVVLPLSFTLKHSPEQEGLLPDGESPVSSVNGGPGAGRAAGIAEVDFSLRGSMATSAFWVLAACMFMHQMSQAAIFVHLIPYLIDKGIRPTSAAAVVTIVAAVSVVGRYGSGWLGDRVNKKYLLIVLFLLQPVAIFSLTRVQSLTDVVPFALLYSIAYGGITVVNAIVIGEYYGRKHYGTIYGTVQGLSTFGGIAGPLVAGWIYDIHGSYHLAFMIFVGMLVFATLLLLFLKVPPSDIDGPLSQRKGFGIKQHHFLYFSFFTTRSSHAYD